MSDYTPTQVYLGKDSLSTGDPEKLILGGDLDGEFNALQTAIATKFDITDIATQAQAEAGTSNAVLMTPLRVAQLLSDSGGSGAGIVNDLIGLADPDADRIIFWDDSTGSAAFLTVGTGLTLSGTTLSSNDSAINHDNLTGFVANEHINHTSVTITAGSGLSYSTGGTDISASATIDLDVNSLTTQTVVDTAADFIAMFDASATAMVKVSVDAFVGEALGDGHWYRSSTQALSAATEATIVYNAAEYDALEKGTFSLSTGEYTVGSAATRIWVTAKVTTTAQDDDESLEIEVQVQGITKLREFVFVDADNDTPETVLSVQGALNLSASDVVRVRVTSSTAETVDSGTQKTSFDIMEIG